MTDIPNTKLIPLSQGKFAIVDAEDYKFLMQWKWCAVKAPYGRFYAKKGIYIRKTATQKWKKRVISMQNFILGLDRSALVDHINGDGLDNRRCNLRNCNKSENNTNARKCHIKCSSKYKGVTWHSQHKKWYVSIQKNRRSIYLGLYDSETDAALAYNLAASEYHGEFALLNEISQ